MMHGRSAKTRTFFGAAGAAFMCLVGIAQAQPTAQPYPTATYAPTPVPSSTYRPGPVPSSTWMPTPAPTFAPSTPLPATSTASPGSTSTAIPFSASAVPELPPADQASPLPFPAYGTPAPSTSPRPQAGIPQVVTLQQAILIAYARSPLLAEARAQVAIATAPVGLAQSALFPAITGVASSSRSYRQAEGVTVTGATPSPTSTPAGSGAAGPAYTTSNGLNAQLSQLIFDGGRVAAEIRGARATQYASIATYQRELQTVAYNAATAYYNALTAQRQTQVDLATVRLDQVQENLVTAQIRAGTAARTDLYTAQLPTAQARVAVVRAQASAAVALATFANALGLDADVAVQPKDDVPALSATSGTLAVNPAFPTPSYAAALTRAIALRPDLVSAQQNVVSFQQNLRAARLGNFPSINASAAYGTNSTDISGGTYRNSGSAGLTLTVPIYDRGVTRAQTEQAQGQLDNAVAQLVAAQQGIQLNVRSALFNLVAAYAALDQTNAELTQAQQVLLSTEAQYRAGVTTLPLLLNAQVGITTALTDEVNAAYAVRQAEQALLYAEGANAAG
jgi:outer membrane protein TolC